MRNSKATQTSKSPAWPASKRPQPGELTFLVNRKYRPLLETSQASAILVARDAGPVPMAALRSPNPYLDFARAIELFHPAPQYAPGIHPTAVIAQSAKIGAGAHIGPYCYRGRKRRNRRERRAAQLRLHLSRRAKSATIFSRTRTPAFARIAASAIACCCRTESLSAATASDSRAKPTAAGTRCARRESR